MTDPELRAMTTIQQTLEDLPLAAQQRVWQWVGDKLGLVAAVVPAGGRPAGSAGLADLMYAAAPRNGPERALMAAYHLEEQQRRVPWGGRDLNDALKDLGHGLSNVTQTLGALAGRRPALVMHVGKTRRNRRAFHHYKLTRAGVSEAADMLARGASHA